MGLLTDTYSDILKKLQGIQPADDPSGLSSDFDSSLGDGIKASLRERKGGSPLTQPGGNIFPTSIVPQNILKQNKTTKIPEQDASVNIPEVQVNTEASSALGNDNNFLNKFASLVGVDPTKVAATWKDKGGFDGLMANPAFTMGLAFLQAGANGKTIGQGVLDNVLKAGVISEQYKKKLADKTEVLEVTASDVADMKAELQNYNIFQPNAFEQFFGKAFSLGKKDPQKAYDKAAELFALEYKKEIRAASAAAKKAGKDFVVDSATRKRIIEKVIKEKKAKVKKNLIPFLKSTVEAPQESYTLPGLAHGGTAHAGKAHLVGEKGPEVFIPKETGEVVANDDSQVFTMLLAANPQLQKISKERAMKILKAKFPEYFD